jgi:nucleoside-diphosphate-sugar epimerase
MNILLTGVNGFIGGHLIDLLKDNHNLFLLEHTESGRWPNTLIFDLADTETVKSRFKFELINQEIDIVIHCAAILVNAENIYDINIFRNNNAITESLIHIFKTSHAKKIVNISSIGVYPNSTETYTEQSRVMPSVNSECLYGLSKFCSEELFNFFLKESIVINLRLGQVYGPGMREDRIYSIMLAELRKFNRITVYGNGERISNFISINYFKQIIGRIINDSIPSGTYNLGEQNISYLNLAELIICEFGNTESKIILLNEGVKSKVYIDSTKLLSVLN